MSHSNQLPCVNQKSVLSRHQTGGYLVLCLLVSRTRSNNPIVSRPPSPRCFLIATHHYGTHVMSPKSHIFQRQERNFLRASVYQNLKVEWWLRLSPSLGQHIPSFFQLSQTFCLLNLKENWPVQVNPHISWGGLLWVSTTNGSHNQSLYRKVEWGLRATVIGQAWWPDIGVLKSWN